MKHFFTLFISENVVIAGATDEEKVTHPFGVIVVKGPINVRGILTLTPPLCPTTLISSGLLLSLLCTIQPKIKKRKNKPVTISEGKKTHNP